MEKLDFLNSPAIQEKAKKILELMQDPNFSKACQNIIQYPDMKVFYIAMIATFLIYGLIRYYALSRTEDWFKSWIISILLYLCFPFVLFGVSYLFFKQDLIVLIKGAASIF